MLNKHISNKRNQKVNSVELNGLKLRWSYFSNENSLSNSTSKYNKYYAPKCISSTFKTLMNENT